MSTCRKELAPREGIIVKTLDFAGTEAGTIAREVQHDFCAWEHAARWFETLLPQPAPTETVSTDATITTPEPVDLTPPADEVTDEHAEAPAEPASEPTASTDTPTEPAE